MKKIVIIGAGLGGLALACRLAKEGDTVEIYEKNAVSGGRVAHKKVKGYSIDIGPTFVLMPQEFEELFSYCGKNFRETVPLQSLSPNYRLHFSDSTHFDMHSSLPEAVVELKRYSPNDVQGYYDFLAYHQPKFETIYSHFISKPAQSLLKTIFSPRIIDLLNADGFISMWEHTGKFFKNENLQLAFSFQSMYLGESPHATPGTYSMVPFVELTQGVWFPTNGIRSIILEIEKMAASLGVKIHYRKPVKEILIENGKATGIALANGELVSGDVIVSNVDLPAAYTKLIPPAKRKIMTDKKINLLKYSCSAFMLYLGVDKIPDSLKHHNVFFAPDYEKNFQQLFESNEISEDPSFYVNVPTLTNPKLAPKGKHLLFVLVPVPAKPNQNGNAWNWEEKKESYANMIIQKMEARGFTNLKRRIKMKEIFTPNDWESLAGMHFGSTFGLSPIFLQSSVFRPQQKSEEFSNLYFVGASTHPGSGMPMVLISARTCQELISSEKMNTK